MLKKQLYTAAIAAFFMSNSYAQDLLEGDTRLACEAILCLSSGNQPAECSPSLNRYFSIWDKKPWKMIQKRINFLNLCPASNEPNMPTLINAIGHGAGRCDAEFLNARNTFTYEEQVCKKYGWRSDDETCHTVQKTAISKDLPKYCGIYQNHEWTYQVGVKYVGEPTQGGKWVNSQDYERELQIWSDSHTQEISTTTYETIIEDTKQHDTR